MSLERVEEVKKRRPFSLWDILVYGVLAAFILILFVVFVFTADRSPISGIKIIYGGETVYSYAFDGDEEIASGWTDKIATEKNGEEYFVTLKTEKGFNTLVIDLAKKSAKMRDTDCSRHKDCLYMAEVAAKNGVIVCVPHGLKILALDGEEDFDHPTIG